jgi:AraC-like DNA-binding protein
MQPPTRRHAPGRAATQLHLWKPPGLAGITMFRAEHFQQHFARHSHDEYALGVVTSGVLGFEYRGEYVRAGAGEVNVVVPGEIHTGEPAFGDDWGYRMFYIEPAVMSDVARQLGRRAGHLPFFRAGVIKDAALAATIAELHVDLHAQHVSQLEAQSRLIALLAAWTRRHGESTCHISRDSVHAPDVARAREYLDDCWQRKPTLSELAAVVQLSPYQLLRAFLHSYGLPPHAYLIQRQLREARRLLDAGSSIADAAHACGFADQSHLHRHFKRTWGVTPGQYRNFVQERGARRN